MAARRIIRRGKPEVEVEPEDEVVEVETEVESEVELEDDIPAFEPPKVSKKKHQEDVEEYEVSPVKRKVVIPEKLAKKDVNENPPRQLMEVKPLVKTYAENLVMTIFDRMSVGKSIVITRNEDGDYILKDAAAVKSDKPKVNWAEYDATVMTPEYHDWRAEWREKPYEEKLKLAKKAGAKWEEHEDQRINLMRLMEAYCEKKGIEKYNAAYKDSATRKAFRSGK